VHWNPCGEIRFGARGHSPAIDAHGHAAKDRSLAAAGAPPDHERTGDRRLPAPKSARRISGSSPLRAVHALLAAGRRKPISSLVDDA
jgi:hypothetical protein